MSRSKKRKIARARGKWTGMPLASVVLAGGSIAAPAPPPSSGQDPVLASQQLTLDEVVVTAEKRSEDLQKVPISMTVLGNEKLEQLQVGGFDDFAKFLPSVSYQSFGPGQAQLYFRGISNGGDGLHAGSLPTTGVYLDEIPVTTINNTLDVHIYDIARVEALAGPQGTLYGASSLSGTLRIITNKPDPHGFAAGYDLKADKYGKGNGAGEFEGFINVPLGDNAAIRLVGYYDHEGGYINNVFQQNTIGFGYAGNAGLGIPPLPDTPITYNNAAAVKARANPVDTYGGRVALKFDINDNWTATPQLIAQGQVADGNFTYDPKRGDLNVSDYRLGYNRDKWYQSALTVEGKVANFNVVYSGGWFERKVDNLSDYSGYTIGYDQQAHLPGYYSNYDRFVAPNGSLVNPFQYNTADDKYTKMSHELRISSPQDYRMKGTVGLFYQRQTDDIRVQSRVDNLPAYYAVDGQTDVLYLSQMGRVDRDYAVFTDVTFDLTSQWKMSGGIRKFWVENTLFGFSGLQSSESACDPPVSAATIIVNYWPCVDTNKKVTENGETHHLTLTYQVNNNAMAYTTYSTGFRPGGNNRRVGVVPYAADTLTNIEGGWKTAWFNNSLRFNGALFYERWKNAQESVTGVNGITSIVNVGAAAVKGVETELSWLPLEGLTLTAAGTYVNARTLQEFCDVDQTTELVTHSCVLDPTEPPGKQLNAPKGTQLPITPELKANGTARYNFHIAEYESFVQAAVVHQSSARSQLDIALNNLMGTMPAFTTFDFSAGAGHNNWHVETYIENAFDKRADLGRVAQCGVIYCYTNYRSYPVKPMNFGIRFGQKF